MVKDVKELSRVLPMKRSQQSKIKSEMGI